VDRTLSPVWRETAKKEVPVEILLVLLGAVAGALASAGISAYRERPRLKLRWGTTTAIGRKPAAWIEVRNAGGRATTLREVGFYGKRVRFETRDRARGEGEATFPFARGVFLERGETKRFEGAPSIDTFGFHADFPLRVYAVDERDRRVWGSAGPVVRDLVGPNPPLTDDDPEALKALFRPLEEPQYPAQIEPRWKLWKRRELRNPKAYKPES
jgi:hypothetical protein